ncbi:MAG: hypothetical protein Aurels2KO_03770 [Aureliella sp.]
MGGSTTILFVAISAQVDATASDAMPAESEARERQISRTKVDKQWFAQRWRRTDFQADSHGI